jgi:hypothetical protein
MVLDLSWSLIGFDMGLVITVSIFLYASFYEPLSKDNLKKRKVIYKIAKTFSNDILKDIKSLISICWLVVALITLIKLISYTGYSWVRFSNLFGWIFFIFQLFMIFYFFRWSWRKAFLTKKMIEENWSLQVILEKFKIKHNRIFVDISLGKKISSTDLENFILDYFYNYGG